MIRKGLFFLYILLTSFAHPVHVSVTNIEYDEERKSFFISFRIFADDFETIIFNKYGVNLRLGKENELRDQQIYFDRYISESFKFVVNKNKRLNKIFEGKKMDEVAVWLYYRFDCRQKVRSAEITNSIMMDLFSDQTNLVIFKFVDFEKGYRLTNNKKNIIINLKQ
jgi:hypothetical protein